MAILRRKNLLNWPYAIYAEWNFMPLSEQNRTEQNFYLQLNSGHTQVAYEIKQYICQK